jgi:hypothetical protein
MGRAPSAGASPVCPGVECLKGSWPLHLFVVLGCALVGVADREETTGVWFEIEQCVHVRGSKLTGRLPCAPIAARSGLVSVRRLDCPGSDTIRGVTSMSIKLTDTQIVVLSAAAQRDDRCLLAPQNLKGSATQKLATKLIGAGLAKEIKAKPGAPVWRQDEQAGLSFALKLTAAGAKAIVIDDNAASDATREGTDPRVQVTTTGSQVVEATADVPAAAPSLSAPRGGTKLARVLELLQRDCGATLEELIAATNWLPHTTRAALTGLRKRGCAVTIDRHDKGRGSTYRARLGETIEVEQAGSQSDAPPAMSATPKSKNARRVERPRAQQAT